MHRVIARSALLILSFLIFTSLNAQSFNGKTMWSNTLDLSSIVSSSVKSIAVSNGQKVKKGEQLLTMDDTRLKLDTRIDKAHLDALVPVKAQADMDLNRAFELYDRELITDVALKEAEFKFAKEKAKYDAALAVYEKSQFLLASATIRSPINGRVLQLNTSIGFYSDQEKARSLITLVDDTKMYAIAHLKISQWDRSLVGKNAIVVINKKHHSGTVKSIGLLPLAKANGISVYPIVVEFNTKKLLPQGMPLTINIK